MGGRVFQSLEEVIERYQQEQIVEGFRLETPVLKDNQRNDWTNQSRDQSSVYQTIRESRESVQKNRSVVISGFLLKKSQKHKKWKNLFFLLNSKDQHLYYYENERRTRPKGIVDLSYSYVYATHDSLFDKPNCFQVVERALPWSVTRQYCLPSNLSLSSLVWPPFII